MTAAVMTGHGGPEVLVVRDDVPVPAPETGEVLVRVTAAAVNNTDVWTREGAYGRPGDPDAVAGWLGVPIATPRVQGADVVGVVDGLGAGAPAALLGRRVLVDPAFLEGTGPAAELVAVLGSERDGGFAEFVAVPASHVHDVTDAPLDDVELACLPIAYGTAAGMLDRAGVATGETVLVTGASGGVGLALVQLAVARGARVVGLTSASGEEAVLAAGAVATVDRGGDEVADDVLAAADGAVDVVADVVGGWAVGALLDVLPTGGRWVVAGAVAGPVVELDLRRLYLRNRRLLGSTMHTGEQFAQLVEVARRGDVAPAVDSTFPLTEIAAAQERFHAADRTGKVVLLP